MKKVLTPETEVAGNKYIACLWDSVRAHGVVVDNFGDDSDPFNLGALTKDLKKEQERGKVIHLHWLTSFFYDKHHQPENKWVARWHNLSFTTANISRLLRLKLGGYRIVWTIHNTLSHGTRINIPERVFRWAMRFLCDDIIVMSRFSRDEFSGRYGRTHGVHVVPHGNYVGVYPNAMDQQTARNKLGIQQDQKVLLHLGMIRPYKGVDDLISAFAKIPDDKSTLIIAGVCWEPELRAAIEREVAKDARILLHMDFVADEDIQIYMNACDWVVLPYKRILNSGSALLALSFGRPVIIPQQGSLVEIIEDGVHGLMYESNDVLLETLRRALAIPSNQHHQLCENSLALAKKYDWSDIGVQLTQIYEAKS